MKKLGTLLLGSTLACTMLFGLTGCGEDKLVGEWTGWNSEEGLYGINVGQDEEFTPSFYQVEIEKNGKDYLVTANRYNYSWPLSIKQAKEKSLSLDYNFKLNKHPILEKVTTENINNISDMKDGPSPAKLSYVEKDKAIYYLEDNKVVATLKKNDAQAFSDFKSSMHEKLNQIAQNPIPHVGVPKQESVSPKSINFDESSYSSNQQKE